MPGTERWRVPTRPLENKNTSGRDSFEIGDKVFNRGAPFVSLTHFATLASQCPRDVRFGVPVLFEISEIIDDHGDFQSFRYAQKDLAPGALKGLLAGLGGRHLGLAKAANRAIYLGFTVILP